METDPSLSLGRKTNSKLLKNPKIKTLIMMVMVVVMIILTISFKVLEKKNIEKTLQGKEVLQRTLVTTEMTLRLGRWEQCTKQSLHSPEAIITVERWPTEWKQISANCVSGRGLVSRLFEDLNKFLLFY